jgi:hypothetical protein
MISGCAVAIGALCGEVWGPSENEYAVLYPAAGVLVLGPPAVFILGTVVAAPGPIERLVIAIRHGSRRIVSSRMVSRKTPGRFADAVVEWIARHKAGMLASSIAAALALGAIALFIAFGEDDGKQLTSLVTKVGGYVAIGGLVLGLPALGYAMVTDRAVEKLADALGVTKEELVSIGDQIGARIRKILQDWGEKLPDEHHVQVFVPNRQRTRLVPLYDPKGFGPSEGWEINRDAPQAITGSAWVENLYLYATDKDRLKDPGLRLTSDQARRYDHLRGVAAAPIRTDGKKIGVLTIFTAVDPKMTDPEFIALHRRLADALSSTISEYVADAGPLKLESINAEQAPSHKSGSVV